MKAVPAEVPPQLLAERRRTGADRWDEMWEGVLHMPPMPSRRHQELEGAMYVWLSTHWAEPEGNRVYPPLNVASVGGWPHDYRIPDLVLLKPDRLSIDRDEYLQGAPTVVVEIPSPGDETIEKMPFYAKLGVPEVWVIDRDTKKPEVHLLRGNQYKKQRADSEGWVRSRVTSVRLRAEPGEKLTVQMSDDQDTRRILPEGCTQ